MPGLCRECPFIPAASPSLFSFPPAATPFPRALMGPVLCGSVLPPRLSGAITKGYEQDVGTRTTFYGFTAFSITQSLLVLGGRGFPHVPLGKVSTEEPAWPPTESEWGARAEKGSLVSRVWSLAGAGSVHPRGKSGEDGQTGLRGASGQPGVGAKPLPPTSQPLGPEGRTPGALTVLGPQDVRYLHFLEGTRDYEWLEALLLNQTLVKSSLSWFRYSLPPTPPQAELRIERL